MVCLPFFALLFAPSSSYVRILAGPLWSVGRSRGVRPRSIQQQHFLLLRSVFPRVRYRPSLTSVSFDRTRVSRLQRSRLQCFSMFMVFCRQFGRFGLPLYRFAFLFVHFCFLRDIRSVFRLLVENAISSYRTLSEPDLSRSRQSGAVRFAVIGISVPALIFRSPETRRGVKSWLLTRR